MTYIFAVCHEEDKEYVRIKDVKVKFTALDINGNYYLGERTTNENGEAILGNVNTGYYGWKVRADCHDPQGRYSDTRKEDLCVGPEKIIWCPMKLEHSTEITVNVLTPEVTEGGTISLAVAVKCLAAGCSLAGKYANIDDMGTGIPPEGVVYRGILGPDNKVLFNIPTVDAKKYPPGSYTWKAKFPRQSPHKGGVAK